MSGERGPQLDAFSVDVRAHLARSVASLYSHLVTRPTGRAVRTAIEHQLGELGGPTLSLLDLSEVSVLDYSCADEVVAKLLLRYAGSLEPIYFLLRGVRVHHMDPIEAVLQRHGLAVVAETAPSRFDLLGARTQLERELWDRVEEQRALSAEQAGDLSGEPGMGEALALLLRRRLLFREPLRGDVHALSAWVGASGSARP